MLSPSADRLKIAESVPALRTVEFAAKGSEVPVVEVTAPRPYPGLPDPLRVVKLPPITTLLPSGDTTSPYARPCAITGAHAVVAPVAALAAAARPGRETPADWLKFPAKYTVLAVESTAKTSPFAEAAKVGMTAPVAASNATIRLRVEPFTWVNAPPT